MSTLGIPFPDPHYLEKVGRALYAADYFVTGPLGDLQHIPNLPSKYQEQKLRKCPIGKLVEKFEQAAVDPAIADVDRAWFAAWAKALSAVRETRNDLVHAYSASTSDLTTQILVRYLADAAITIDDTWFESFDQLLIEQWRNLRDSERPLNRYADGGS